MIITAEKFKEFVSTDTDDKILAQKLSALENLIRNYTHNNFQVREIRSRSEILDGRVLNPPKYISKGDTVQITDSLLNNGIYIVEDVNENEMILSGTLLDCAENLITKVEYPPDIIAGAVNMLKWDLENRDKVGIQSETISRHSVTYFNMDGENAIMGYPKSLLGFLKPYMKARF